MTTNPKELISKVEVEDMGNAPKDRRVRAWDSWLGSQGWEDVEWSDDKNCWVSSHDIGLEMHPICWRDEGLPQL